MSYDGASMDSVEGIAVGASNSGFNLYQLVGPSTGTNVLSVTFSPNHGAPDTYAYFWVTDGTDQTTPVDDSGNYNSGTAAASISLTTSDADTPLIGGFVSRGTGSSGFTPQGGATERFDSINGFHRATFLDRVAASSGSNSLASTVVGSSGTITGAAVAVASSAPAPTPVELDGQADAVSGSQSDLTTGINLNGQADAVSGSQSDLTTGINLNGQADAVSGSQSDLTTGINLNGQADAVSGSQSDLTAGINLNGQADAVSGSQSDLTTVINLNGQADAVSGSQSDLTTGINLNGQADAVSGSQSDLTTLALISTAKLMRYRDLSQI